MRLVKTFLFVSLLSVTVTPVQAAWQAGLRGGTISGTSINTVGYPAASAIYRDPHAATSYVAITSASTEPWKLNQTWVYSGQFYSAGASYVFASKIDERCYLRIGASVLLPGTANNAFAVSVVTNIPAGWHPFELRMFNSTTAAGPSANVGLANKIGFGYNTNSYIGQVGANYTYPADDGGMSLFRYDDGLGFADELLVTGDTGNYGTIAPPYGITNGLATSDTFDCSAPAEMFEAEPGVRVRCAGYALYTNTTATPMLVSSGTTNAFTYTHDRWANLVWQWERRFLVNIATGPGGGVSTSGGWYDEGSNVTVTATPDVGAGFSHWTGDIPPAYRLHATLSMPADSPRNIMANFTGTVWQAGLRAGSVAGYQNYTAIPDASYVKAGPHIVTNRVAELVPINSTWAYTGQIYLNGGPYRFGYAMYTFVYLRINGTVYLNNGYANNLSPVIELPAGWYDFDLRVTRSYSTGVPSGANNWPLNLGFGMTTNRNATASGIYFSYPQDPGDMSLFRCAADPEPAAGALLVRGKIGYDDTPNLPAPYLISPLDPGDTVELAAPINHFSTATKMYVRCIGYDLLTNGILKTSGTGTSLTYTHTDDLPELVWKWRRDFLPIVWTNAAGGDFRNPGNWKPGIVPERSDTAIFDLTPNPYTVTWSGNATSLNFKVNSGAPTWNLQGNTYFFQNQLVTEYGTNNAPCTIGTSTTPVDLLITNGTVNFIATKDTYSKIYGAGTKVRVHDAKLTLQYLELAAGALLEASGPSALFQSFGYTLHIYGTLVSTNGALHNTSAQIRLRPGSLCVLSPASGGQTQLTALYNLDSGSELRLLDGAKVSSSYIGGTPLQRTKLYGLLTLLGSGNHLWDIYNGSGSYIPTLSVEAQGRVQGSGKLEFTYVENAGQVWPGGSNSVGSLEIKGNMTNRNEGTIVMELAGPTQYDQIAVTKGAGTGIGKLWAGGTLSVNLIGTYKPVYDDSFKLFSFVAAANTFNALSLPGGNEKWDTSKLYTEGIIRYSVLPGTLFLVR